MVRLAAGSFYKRLIRESSNLALAKNRYLRALRQNAEDTYRINMGKKMWKLDYIVGVATAADSRHRGHMRDVLMKMLGDMHQDRKPFCYLMPASPDIQALWVPVYI